METISVVLITLGMVGLSLLIISDIYIQKTYIKAGGSDPVVLTIIKYYKYVMYFTSLTLIGGIIIRVL